MVLVNNPAVADANCDRPEEQVGCQMWRGPVGEGGGGGGGRGQGIIQDMELMNDPAVADANCDRLEEQVGHQKWIQTGKSQAFDPAHSSSYSENEAHVYKGASYFIVYLMNRLDLKYALSEDEIW